MTSSCPRGSCMIALSRQVTTGDAATATATTAATTAAAAAAHELFGLQVGQGRQNGLTEQQQTADFLLQFL